MNADQPDFHFERGLLLYNQNRYPAAEAELRLALAEDPAHVMAHAVLALCLAEQGRVEDAEAEAEQAVRLDPGVAFAHYARAQVRVKQGRAAEAEEAVREAIRLDPIEAGFYALLAAIRLDRRDAAGAVRAAEQGLAHDPAHPGCSALRTMALLRLGRTADATGETADALRRDPQDALAHAGHGWALLHARRPAEALSHFREALRLDPTSEWARSGLIEALKARYWVYRQMLGFFLWMGRRGSGVQWAVVIGLLVVQQGLGAAARNNPALRPVAQPALYALFGFALLSWLAGPLFTLLLRLNRFGRLALRPEEVRQSNWVGGVFAVGLLAAAVAVLDDGAAGQIGIGTALTFALLLTPVAAVFRVPAGWRRKALVAHVAGMLVVWAGMVWHIVEWEQATDQWRRRAAFRDATELFETNMIAGLVAGFLANGLIAARR